MLGGRHAIRITGASTIERIKPIGHDVNKHTLQQTLKDVAHTNGK
jgi:hypothetical protein